MNRVYKADGLERLALGYRSEEIGESRIVHADCFEWLARLPEMSLHGIVTDPPYGVKEFDLDQIVKRAAGRGGIWRIPSSSTDPERTLSWASRSPSPKRTNRMRRTLFGFADSFIAVRIATSAASSTG